MKIKKMLSLLLGALVMLPMMQSCSGEGSSKSPFGTLPKVYEEYLQSGEKLKKEAEKIKTDEDKAKYLEKSEKLKKEWSEKIAKAAKKLDGKTVNFEDGEFTVTEPISFQFNDISEKAYLHAVFNINGTAVTADDTTLARDFYAKDASVKLVGYDSEGQQLFKSNVGVIACQEKDGKSFIPKGTPIKFEFFQFGGKDAPTYGNTAVLKFEVINP